MLHYIFVLFIFTVASFLAGAMYGRSAEAKAAVEFRALVAGAKKEIDKVL